MSQLFMRNNCLQTLPPVVLPDGISVVTHNDSLEREWEALIEASFGMHYSFQTMLTDWKGYSPECVFYLMKDEKYIATAAAVENADFPSEGWLHMVGTHPDARGLGLGRIVTLLVLHAFRDRGYSSIVLSTDDHRIPAIATYLKLGFTPLYTDETHEGRWANVLGQIR